jgi:hypothetical protein
MHLIWLRVGLIDSCDLRRSVQVNVMFMTKTGAVSRNKECKQECFSLISQTLTTNSDDSQCALLGDLCDSLCPCLLLFVTHTLEAKLGLSFMG